MFEALCSMWHVSVCLSSSLPTNSPVWTGPILCLSIHPLVVFLSTLCMHLNVQSLVCKRKNRSHHTSVFEFPWALSLVHFWGLSPKTMAGGYDNCGTRPNPTQPLTTDFLKAYCISNLHIPPSHFYSTKVDHHICFMACGAPSAPISLGDIFLLPVIPHLLLFLYWSLNLLKSSRMFLLCGHLRSYWTNKCPHAKTTFKTADTSQPPEVRGREIETGWLEKSWTWIKGTTSLHFLFLHILAQEHVILVTPAKTLIKKPTVRERQIPYDFTLLWI